MTRLRELTIEEMSPEQRIAYDRLSGGPRQGVRGPFPAWLRSPVLANRAEALGRYCRFESGLDARLIEIAVLATAVRWRSAFVFRNHEGLALTSGLTPETVEAIRVGRPPDPGDPVVTVAHALVGELLETGIVGPENWECAVRLLGETGVVNLIAVSGYYGLVCMTVNAAEVGGRVDLEFFGERQEPEPPPPSATAGRPSSGTGRRSPR